MCGRFSLHSDASDLAEHFGLDEEPEWDPRYNLAPSQRIGAIGVDPGTGQRIFRFLRWGLVPHWAGDEALGNRLSQARSESASVKPAFRAAWRRRRCLLPSNGFFEWDREKTPWYVHRPGEELFALAGLWERWSGEEGEIVTCAVLTRESNGPLAEIHGRMPVVLDPGSYAAWLDPDRVSPSDVEAVLEEGLLQGSDFGLRRVGRKVNDARNEGPELILEEG